MPKRKMKPPGRCPQAMRARIEAVSDECEPVSVCQSVAYSGGKPPPFGQRVLSVLLEPVSIVDVAFEVEMVVD